MKLRQRTSIKSMSSNDNTWVKITDDVTRQNTELISRLPKDEKITWCFNDLYTVRMEVAVTNLIFTTTSAKKKKIRKNWICVTLKTNLRLNNYLWWRIRINTKNWGNVKQCLSNWLSHQGTSMELFYFVCLVCLFWKLYVCLCLLDNKHFYLFTIANMQNRHVFWTTTFLMIYIFIWTNLG